MQKYVFAFILFGTGFFQTGSAVAGPLNDALGTCTVINCQAMIIRGTQDGYASSRSARWIEQVYAPNGTCLRLEITAATGGGTDLEMVVVAPDGSVYRDDDDGLNFFPLVKINGENENGYYTVSIGDYLGEPNQNTDFTLRYGVYNLGNPNCASPTPELGAAPIVTAKSGRRR